MTMSGPIIRTGATPEFWKNWDNVFGKKNKQAGKGTAASAEKSSRSAAKKPASAKKATTASASKKAAGKAPAKTSRKK